MRAETLTRTCSLLLLTAFFTPAVLGSDTLSVSVTVRYGFHFPHQFHTLSVDAERKVKLEFCLRDRKDMSDVAAPADIAALRTLLDRAEFFTWADKYPREGDCEAVAADSGSVQISASDG